MADQQIIPFNPSPAANFQFQATLDGSPYNVVCTFNAYAQRYYFSVYDLSGNLIVSRPVVASPSFFNTNLLAGYFTTSMIYRDSSQEFEIPGLPAIPLQRPSKPPPDAPYPLDPISIRPAVAFSTRRLLTSYTGPALRVRRDSDGHEKDILFFAGVLDTKSMLDFVGSGVGTVSIWYDQSGNANNATQSLVSAQPVIASGGDVIISEGFPALYVHLGNLTFNNLTAAQNDFTISSVFSTTQANGVSDPNQGYAMCGFIYGDIGGNSYDLGFGNLGNRMTFWGGGSGGEIGVQGVKSIIDGKNHVAIVARTSFTGSVAIYVDGSLDGSGIGPIGQRYQSTTLQVGSGGINSAPTDGSSSPAVFFTPESVIYASRLTSSNLALLQQAQATYVGA
jgi:hypothetical protein